MSSINPGNFDQNNMNRDDTFATTNTGTGSGGMQGMNPTSMSSGMHTGTNTTRPMGTGDQFADSGVDASYVPPTHRQHNSTDPLPGTKGSAAPTGYPTGTPRSEHPQPPTMGSGTGSRSSFGSGGARDRDDHDDGEHNAFTEDRPLSTRPAPEGGVAIDGQEGLPEGKASTMDKLVGKTQKVTGKMTKNWELHERGELRETGGKAAAQGEARAAHD